MADLATTTRTAPALALDGVSYAYPNAGRDALVDVSLEIGAGELVVLAGRSGCGKTTLLRAACGLVPHFHGGEISGRIEVGGLDAIAAGPGELAAAVGYVAQDPETQVVSTTVAAEIELPLELRGEPPAARARAVEEVALALAIPRAARPDRRHPLGRGAAAGRAGGRARHPPGAGPARRADLTARPRRRRRADLAAAAAERGVGGDDRPRRAPPRALPRRRRPRRRDGRRHDRLRRRPPRLPLLGPGCRPRPGDPGGAPLLAGRHHPASRPASATPAAASRRSSVRGRGRPPLAQLFRAKRRPRGRLGAAKTRVRRGPTRPAARPRAQRSVGRARGRGCEARCPQGRRPAGASAASGWR